MRTQRKVNRATSRTVNQRRLLPTIKVMITTNRCQLYVWKIIIAFDYQTITLMESVSFVMKDGIVFKSD